MDYKNENETGAEGDSGKHPVDGLAGEPIVVSEQTAVPVEPQPQSDGWTQPGAEPPVRKPSYPPYQGASGEPSWNSKMGRESGAQRDDGQGEPRNNVRDGYAKGETGERQSYSQYGQQGSGQTQNQTQYQTQYQTHYQTENKNQQPNQNGMAVASLIMGILSIVTCCCGWIGIVMGVLGIIFALMSRKDQQPMEGNAKAGLIMSAVAIGLNVISIIFVVILQAVAWLPDLMQY